MHGSVCHCYCVNLLDIFPLGSNILDELYANYGFFIFSALVVAHYFRLVTLNCFAGICNSTNSGYHKFIVQRSVLNI